MADKYAAWNLVFYIAVTVYVAGERNGNQNRLNLSLIELELLKEMEISVSSSSNFSLVIGGIVFIIWEKRRTAAMGSIHLREGG